MIDWLNSVLAGRPGWINALMIFCATMAFVYVPWDFFFKPVAQDEEVWLGIMLHGVAAKLSEPLHGAIYAAGAYGFYRMRAWMWPWAAVYAASVAIGMFVWCVLYAADGIGALLLGAAAFVPFAFLTRALWCAEALFGAARAPLSHRYGEWALVTGASAGLGAAFARALARDGVSCVLVARRGERLETLARELEQSYRVATRVVIEDLSDAAAAARLIEAVRDLQIAILVSNAGFGAVGRFEALDVERLSRMVQLHCTVPVVLASRLLPGMRARGRGAIVITGSIAGRQALPLHSVYGATKGFELLLGEALWVELQGSGIDVLVVEPGPVETEFQRVSGEIAHAGQSAEIVVERAFDALGRQPALISTWFDWLRVNLGNRLLPRPLVAFVARDVVRKWTPETRR
ncbi:MAG: SDR family NAD(P)-dependent oxidoreductase [Myxococcales bacterium]|nr:SDR family NAD(P)-dependent oxidoreductase [Myxococcales bacterium]MDH5306787.1 SDR family NAD(P)-dependent oxidoreductase [Myxococcales bacterium]MDH5566414.1 SDR family NAD(P)-dependent oxidoreductase [Myxococcales bacterium]